MQAFRSFQVRRSGGTGVLLLMALAVLAVAAVVARMWIGSLVTASVDSQNIHALNGDLIEREARLAELFSSAELARAESARRTILGFSQDTDCALAQLPPADGSDQLARVVTLARFRDDTESLVAEISDAFTAAARARTAAEAAAADGKKTGREFSEKVEGPLGEWLLIARKDAEELDGWRAQRLEKMNNREFATFQSFQEAASARYRELENRACAAEDLKRKLFDELLPRAENAMSNLAVHVADMHREANRAASACDALRNLPVDQNLFENARREALSAYETAVQRATGALAGFKKTAESFSRDARKGIESLRQRADAMEKAAAELSSASASATAGPAEAVRREANVLVDKTDEFEKDWIALVRDWDDLDKSRRNGESVMERIRRAAWTDESAVVADVVQLERIRIDVEQTDVPKRVDALATAKVEIETALAATDQELREADAARWTAGKDDLRKSLLKIRAAWSSEAKPGWTRPEQDGVALVRSIDELLGRMDSATEAHVLGTVRDIAKRGDALNARISWTPGARYPDNPHIHASDKEWTWDADPGYAFNIPGTSDLSVHWVPDSRHPDHANVHAGPKEGVWVPDPGFKARRSGDLDPVWTPGARHPTKSHIFAATENGRNVWNADPGYWFDNPGENSDLMVSWRPGRRHPDHPHISAGQTEGTWVPDPGYKERWRGDLDPVWTVGVRHPHRPHVFASTENGKNVWDCDPGYVWVEPGSHNLDCFWKPGRNHPDYKGIVSAQQEGKWNLLPGWTWVNPGTSDLRTRWVPKTRHPNWPHVFASNETSVWSHEPGYEWASSDKTDFSVRWVPGVRHPDYEGIVSARQEGRWSLCPGWAWVNPGTSDLRTRWTPGARHPDKPLIHASIEKWKWDADEGYEFVQPGTSNLDVVKKSRTRPPTRRQPQSVPIYKRPISDFIPDY